MAHRRSTRAAGGPGLTDDLAPPILGEPSLGDPSLGDPSLGDPSLGDPSLGDPSLGALFAGFFGIGIMGFGGVLPWARRMVVEQRLWLTPAEFTDLLALCQFLPGPNIVNMAVALGARFRGVAGSAVAVAGLLAAPMAIVVALGGVYARYQHVPAVARGFSGLAAAATGLVVAMAVRIAAPQRGHAAGVGVALLTFAAVALLHTPLLPTMLVMAPLSVLLCRRWPPSRPQSGPRP